MTFPARAGSSSFSSFPFSPLRGPHSFRQKLLTLPISSVVCAAPQPPLYTHTHTHTLSLSLSLSLSKEARAGWGVPWSCSAGRLGSPCLAAHAQLVAALTAGLQLWGSHSIRTRVYGHIGCALYKGAWPGGRVGPSEGLHLCRGRGTCLWSIPLPPFLVTSTWKVLSSPKLCVESPLRRRQFQLEDSPSLWVGLGRGEAGPGAGSRKGGELLTVREERRRTVKPGLGGAWEQG